MSVTGLLLNEPTKSLKPTNIYSKNGSRGRNKHWPNESCGAKNSPRLMSKNSKNGSKSVNRKLRHVSEDANNNWKNVSRGAKKSPRLMNKSSKNGSRPIMNSSSRFFR